MGWFSKDEVKAQTHPATIRFGKTMQKASADRLIQRARRIKASLDSGVPVAKRAVLEAELDAIMVQFTVRKEVLEELEALND